MLPDPSHTLGLCLQGRGQVLLFFSPSPRSQLSFLPLLCTEGWIISGLNGTRTGIFLCPMSWGWNHFHLSTRRLRVWSQIWSLLYVYNKLQVSTTFPHQNLTQQFITMIDSYEETFRTYGGQSSKCSARDKAPQHCVTAFIWKTAWFSEHLSFLIWSQTFLRLFHPNPHLCQTPWSNFCQMWWKLVWSQLWSIWDDDTQTLDLPGLDPDLSPQLGLLLFHYFFISQWNS